MDIELIKLILQFLSMVGVGAIMSGFINRKMIVYENKKTEDEKHRQKETEDSQKLIQYLSDANRLMLRNAIYEICNKVKKEAIFTYTKLRICVKFWKPTKSLAETELHMLPLHMYLKIMK